MFLAFDGSTLLNTQEFEVAVIAPRNILSQTENNSHKQHATVSVVNSI